MPFFMLLTSFQMRSGIIAMSTGAALASNVPTPIYLWMTTNSITGLIWGILLIVLDAAAFYPFFKVAEKQALKQEAEMAAE